jgi:hypothetical protein
LGSGIDSQVALHVTCSKAALIIDVNKTAALSVLQTDDIPAEYQPAGVTLVLILAIGEDLPLFGLRADIDLVALENCRY